MAGRQLAGVRRALVGGVSAARFRVTSVDASTSIDTMDGYCKLHAKIITSSIWNAPNHVRLLWVTMLALADAEGNVEGTPGGLAAMARITPEESRDALKILAGPDPDSGDETSGERIRKVGPSVWHIINHAHYRDRQTRRQVKQAAWAREKRASKRVDASFQSTPNTDTDTHREMDGSMDGSGTSSSQKRTSVPVDVRTRDIQAAVSRVAGRSARGAS